MKFYACLVFGVAVVISGGYCKKRHPPRDLAQEQRNKELVIKFEESFSGDHDESIFDKYVAEDMIQHNGGIADGREAFRQFALHIWAKAPKVPYYIERAVAEGDLVWLHLFNKVTLDAVVTIWRVKDGMFVEHWDVIQVISQTSANPHPYFNAFAVDYQQQCQYVLINPNNITLPSNPILF